MWLYDLALKRYRNKETGRLLSNGQMQGLRDKFIEAQQTEARDLAAKLASRSMEWPEYELKFRDRIKAAYVDSYVLAKGGRKNMTPTDWGRLGSMIKAQYQYGSMFAQQIVNGELSEAMIAHRSSSFMLTASHAYHVGRAASFDLVLPTYPRDGSQKCFYNCGCEWRIVDLGNTVEATWVRHLDDSCETCERNEQIYNPYRVIKPAGARKIAA
jgi:hypothetical protein